MAKSLSAWQKLTWDDLDQWAGSRSVSRGKAYQQQGCVQDLCWFGSDSVLATVTGTESYVTRVTLDEKQQQAERLASVCSCPVAIDCKHAVATVIELLEQLDKHQSIAAVDPHDRRLKRLAGETNSLQGSPSTSLADGAATGPQRVDDKEIRKFLESKTKSDLVDRFVALSRADPAIRDALADEIAVESGRFDDLVQAAYQEMRKVTAEEVWYDEWRGEGASPDYSGLAKRLKTLVELGCVHEVVTLGQELAQRANEQIGRSDDEGDVCEDACEGIAGCLTVVAEALQASSLEDAEKLAIAVRLVRSDSFGVTDPFDAILSQEWPEEAWSTVADELWIELEKLPTGKHFDSSSSSRSQRRQLSNWVIHALDSAGRHEESLEICLSEAKQKGEYLRAIDRLIAEELFERAELVAQEGLRNVDPKYRGTIHELQDRIVVLAKKRSDWRVPASIAAKRFFDQPSVARYYDLLSAAKQANCEDRVAKAAQDFLETRKRPDVSPDGSAKFKRTKAWPLPPPPEPAQKYEPVFSQSSFQRNRPPEPYYSVLIDLAIIDKRPDDVLRWHALQRSARGKLPGSPRLDRSDVRIAKAVEKTHPKWALDFYLRLAHAVADETSVKTYPEVGEYLKCIKPLLATAETDLTWEGILADFRIKHHRKRRLMEVIDRVDGKPVAESAAKKWERPG